MAYPNKYVQELIHCVAKAFLFGKKNADGTYTPFVERQPNNKDTWIADLWKAYDGGTNRGSYCVVGSTVILDEVFKILSENGTYCENPLQRYSLRNNKTSLYGNVAAVLGQTIERGILEWGTTPEPGAVFFRPSTSGNNHAGIVVDILETNEIVTIEANASFDDVPITYGFSEHRYDAVQFAKFDKLKFAEPPASLVPYAFPDGYKTLSSLLADVTGKPNGWQFAYIARGLCTTNLTSSILVPKRIVALGVEVVCEPAEKEKPKEDKKILDPCANSPRPDGDGWEITPATSSAKDNDNYEYSPDFCYRRYTGAQNAEKQPNCTEPKPAGDNWQFRGKSREDDDDAEEWEYSPLKCWKRPAFAADKKKCPTTVDKRTCLPGVQVKAARFSGSLVPHYSWLYQNVYAAADIAGAMDYLQKKPEMVGVALDNAGLGYNAKEATIIESMVSRFTTVRDEKGRLYYIVPEWSQSRINSLFGLQEGAQQFPGLLPPSVFLVATTSSTGGGSGSRSEADAHFMAGIRNDYDGFTWKRRNSLMSPELLLEVEPELKIINKLNTGNTTSSQILEHLRSDANSFAEKMQKRGNRKIKVLTTDDLGANMAQSLVSDTANAGLINWLEASNLPVDIPIVIVLLSPPKPVSFFESLKVFTSIIASVAAVVGIPPQIFSNVLKATETIENLSTGRGSINDIVQLAGAVSALMPESVRGEISSLAAEIQGVPLVKDIAGLGNDAVEFFEKQTKELEKIFSSGVAFAKNINLSNIQGAANVLGINPVGQFTAQLQKDFFGGKEISLKNFAPSWYKAADQYAKQLGLDYEKGFRQGAKLLHSIETLKAADQFARYANSGLLAQDIIANGSALQNDKVQNLLIAGAAGSVMSSMPKINSIANSIISQTTDIKTIDELAAITTVGVGFRTDGAAFERLTLQALAERLNGLRDKVKEFVLPPTLSGRQQECWTKELGECFGITIVPTTDGVKPYEVSTKTIVTVPDITGKTSQGNLQLDVTGKSENKTTPPTDKTAENKPYIVGKLPDCIREINMSWYYCPPPTCAVDVLMAASASAKSQGLSGLDIGQILNTISTAGNIESNAGSISRPNETPQTYTFAPAVTMQPVEIAPTAEAVSAQPEINDCTVKYPARTDAAGNWYALINGKFIQIIDCCIPSQNTECCDKTLQEIAALKTGLQKLTELVLRRADGDTAAPCDIAPLRNDIAELKKRIEAISIQDNSVVTDGLRKEIANLKELVIGIKTYDTRGELSEIKELVKAVKNADYSAVAKEVNDLKEFLKIANDTDKQFLIGRFDALEKIIKEQKQTAQKDYSEDVRAISRNVDALSQNLEDLQTAIQFEIEKLGYEITVKPNAREEIEKLNALKEQQTEIYNTKIEEAKKAVENMPACDECGKLSEILNQLRTLRINTNSSEQKQITATSEQKQITASNQVQTCPGCPKMIVYDYPPAPMSFGGKQTSTQDCNCNCEDDDCSCDC